MYKPVLFLLLLAFSWRTAQGAPPPTNSAADGRVLILENSTMPLTAARATLIIGPLTRTNGVYVGNFKLNIFPYFFKNDRGRLAINVPDKVLLAADQGQTVVVTGTATSTKDGIIRHVEITATPKDRDHGSLSLWFMVGDRKMIFKPGYHFAGITMAAAPAPPLPNLVASLRQN